MGGDMTSRHLCLACSLVVSSLFALACAPKVYSFAISPPNVCGDEFARVTWQARGESILSARVEDPRFDGPAEDDDADEADPTAPDRVVFLLVARGHGPDDQRHAELRRFPFQYRRIVEFPSTLEGNTLAACGRIDPTEWDSHFTISELASASDRALSAQHAGASVALEGNGSYSKALAGSPLAGDWKFVSELSPTEVADRSKLPTSLQISVTVVCR